MKKTLKTEAEELQDALQHAEPGSPLELEIIQRWIVGHDAKIIQSRKIAQVLNEF